jgi:arsenate reductase (glutaredoxin)
MTRIYHNPRCSKSRATLALLEARDIEPEIIEYLENPPSRAELASLIEKLGCAVRDIVRSNEPEFKASGLSMDASDRDLMDLLLKHPKLLQRPIVEHADQARIGRPPERVLELFE